MRRSRNEIRRTAWHEAGHAVFCLATIDGTTRHHHGHPAFKGVWVRRDSEEPDHRGRVESKAQGAVISIDDQIWCDDFTEVSYAMAGIAGERILNRRKKPGKVKFIDWLSGASNDLTLATEIVRDHGRGWDADKVIDQGVEYAWGVLKAYPKAHRLIAEELERDGYVSYEQARGIFESEAAQFSEVCK